MKKYLHLTCIVFSSLVLFAVAHGQSLAAIEKGDRLSIHVTNEEYLNETMTVSEDGNIEYRNLGDIRVAGLSLEVAAARVEELISRNYPFLDNYRVKIIISGKGKSIKETGGDDLDIKVQTIPDSGGFYYEEIKPLYRISPYDSLKISVFGEPDLDQQVRVSEKGTIKYPLLGEVSVEGLTLEEVIKELEFLLGESYFVNPQVSIFITEFARFSISGEVKKAGTFQLEGPLTLEDAFILAGGPKEGADLSQVKVFRSYGIEKGRKEYSISFEKDGKIFYLQPQDRIIVELKEKIYIIGAVANPGTYYVDKEGVSLRDALSFLVGGLDESANTSAVKVIRKENGLDRTYIVDVEIQGSSFLLFPRDRVIVKEYGSISIFGQVKEPGRYPFRVGITAVDAIALAGGFTSVAARNSVRIIRKEEGRQKTIKVPVGRILSTGNISVDVELKENDAIVVPESWF